MSRSGASRSRVLGMILFDVLKLTIPGIPVGLVLTAVVIRLSARTWESRSAAWSRSHISTALRLQYSSGSVRVLRRHGAPRRYGRCWPCVRNRIENVASRQYRSSACGRSTVCHVLSIPSVLEGEDGRHDNVYVRSNTATIPGLVRLTCYALGPFAAPILLSMHRYRRNWAVRYHAYHATLLATLCLGIWSALELFEHATRSWFLATLIHEIQLLFLAGTLLFWGALTFTAYLGERCVGVSAIHQYADHLARKTQRRREAGSKRSFTPDQQR